MPLLSGPRLALTKRSAAALLSLAPPLAGDRGLLQSRAMCRVPWQFRHLSGRRHVAILWAQDRQLRHRSCMMLGILFRRRWFPVRLWLDEAWL